MYTIARLENLHKETDTGSSLKYLTKNNTNSKVSAYTERSMWHKTRHVCHRNSAHISVAYDLP
jgi:hypothetical protein